MEQRFRLYLNILPVVEQGAMYLLFIAGAILITITIYRLTFKIMFKSLESKKSKKDNNFVIGTDLWIDRRKNKKDNDSVYVPCEIPLSATETDYNTDYDRQFEIERRPSALKTHSDRLKELSHRLSDKVYDSVGSIKDKVREITHVKNIFKDEHRDSLVVNDTNESQTNEAFKSDSSDSEKEYQGYKAVQQSDSDDDCKYLEVLDDGSEFLNSARHLTERANNLKNLDSTDKNDLIIHISDSD